MRIAVPDETGANERRVALVPEVVRMLTAKGHEIEVESSAGSGARIPDALFEQAGARVRVGPSAAQDADVVTRVSVPSEEEIERLPRRGGPEFTLIRPSGEFELSLSILLDGIAAPARRHRPNTV